MGNFSLKKIKFVPKTSVKMIKKKITKNFRNQDIMTKSSNVPYLSFSTRSKTILKIMSIRKIEMLPKNLNFKILAWPFSSKCLSHIFIVTLFWCQKFFYKFLNHFQWNFWTNFIIFIMKNFPSDFLWYFSRQTFTTFLNLFNFMEFQGKTN